MSLTLTGVCDGCLGFAIKAFTVGDVYDFRVMDGPEYKKSSRDPEHLRSSRVYSEELIVFAINSLSHSWFCNEGLGLFWL